MGGKKRFTTKRLVLRGIGDKKSDVEDIVEACRHLSVSKWLLLVPYPYTEKDAVNWINFCRKNYKKKNSDGYELAIELKKEKKMIGAISLMRVDKTNGTASVGYWVNPDYHRKGYASEALKAVLDFAFKKLKLRRVEAGVFKGNPSSGKLLEKFGAKKEGIKRKARISKATGKANDEIFYGLLREDYK